MEKIDIYFDGFCPESLLKGQQVEMRLNTDDFWESEATGLQIALFPPYATILKWRGQGKFRPDSDLASNSVAGLVLTGAEEGNANEHLPDEKNILGTTFDLEWYCEEVYDSKEEYDAARFNPDDPVFDAQKQHLHSLSAQDLAQLFVHYERLRAGGYGADFMNSEAFQKLHEEIYEQKLIFGYKWMAWHRGWKNINDTTFNYAPSSLLELSMYLTAIFRADRFTEGTIEINFKNGTVDKIFHQLKYQLSLTTGHS